MSDHCSSEIAIGWTASYPVDSATRSKMVAGYEFLTACGETKPGAIIWHVRVIEVVSESVVRIEFLHESGRIQ